MSGIIEWHDMVCDMLREGLKLATPTSSYVEPTATIQFSKELIEKMLDESPYTSVSKVR